MIAGFLRRLLTARTPRERAAVAKAGHPSAGSASASDADFLAQAHAHARAGRLEAALEGYRACAARPGIALAALIECGNTLVDLWDIPAALEAYEAALERSPQSTELLSALIFHSRYLETPDFERLRSLEQRYAAIVQRESAASVPLPDRDAGRRLRIGYVSPNFSRHSVGYFIEPVIRAHDRTQHEIYCYYSHPKSDDTTARIREAADGWREIASLDDAAVTGMIVRDRIDILVDLAGHSKGNRLRVFAGRPAPVQMTWLGYPDTTGLAAIDYRIVDEITDPAPAADAWHSEKLLRIAESFLCYLPPPDAPEVELRFAADDGIVFGCCNSLQKVHPATLALWARILEAVPGSRLIVKAAALDYPDTVDRFEACLQAQGIDASRVELCGWIGDRGAHLGHYRHIDIALDTSPYNGTTTTCEALWMGVPVITLAGSRHLSRVGAMLLACAGLDDLVAGTSDDYVRIAVALAGDRTRLHALRGELRERLRASPLLDHAGYTRRLEAGYRAAWAQFCAVAAGLRR